MGAAAIYGSVPLPDDYKGSVSDQMIQFLKSGKVPINGDKDKAMKAVYEGVGFGKEAERFLPLGADMYTCVKGVSEQLVRSLEVWGEVTNNVNIDK